MAYGATGNLVERNFVGLNASGTSVVRGFSNANGIIVYLSPGNTIGGTTPSARNVIAGQPADGIQDSNSGRTLIEGNYVGTDITGTIALPNVTGISLAYGSTGAIVGGTAAGAGNLVSSNSDQGIYVDGGALVEGNLVGTDITGTRALGNGGPVIQASSSRNNLGGTASGADNLISANGIGVLFDYNTGSDNVLLGNRVGTAATGTSALGNTSDGVQFTGGSANSTVGGSTAAAGNVIAFNGGAGIGVLSTGYQVPVGAEVVGNSIHDNAGLGIDLGDDGVTPNTPEGPDSGPKDLQNYPVVGSSATYPIKAGPTSRGR